MVYRHPNASPASRLPEERQGRVVNRYCRVCGSFYPLHRGRHTGKSTYGKDHIASPCAHEGELFTPGADWWEDAVELLPEALAGDPGIVGSPAPGTGPEATGAKP
jgi:hypothetical protein